MTESTVPNPAVEILKSMNWTPRQTISLVENSLAQALGPCAPLEGWITIEVENDENDTVRNLEMKMTVATVDLAAEIISAAADGSLRIETRTVVLRRFSQARLLLFVDDRILGQLFASRDGEYLMLAVAELTGTRDLGTGIIAVRDDDFEIHTL
jgi:hypothetical protein